MPSALVDISTTTDVTPNIGATQTTRILGFMLVAAGSVTVTFNNNDNSPTTLPTLLLAANVPVVVPPTPGWEWTLGTGWKLRLTLSAAVRVTGSVVYAIEG